MDGTTAAVALLAALLLGVVLGVLLARRLGMGGVAGLDVEQRLEGLSAGLDRRLAALDQRLWRGLDGVQHGQLEAAGSAAEVRGLAQRILEQGRELARLEDLLRPPQARGQFGELLLEQVLAQGLPPGTWHTQHPFRSGHRVDAVVLVGDHLVPIDAKFPLDAFARLTSADGEAEAARHRAAFARAARGHVDAIADKYVRPDEGTLDFALCYVPSEAVYYEFLRADAAGASPFRHAVERRVFPVSPTTLYAYLLSIGVGLRGLRVEANARRILDALRGLEGDLGRVREDVEVVGKHLTNARSRWDDAVRKLDRFGGSLAEVAERADALDDEHSS